VKCILSYLRSPLLKRRKAKYKIEREAKESRVNTQPAPCPPDPHYISFACALSTAYLNKQGPNDQTLELRDC
jgi:hypothetical protein